ncbi:hypothetical protein PCI56_24955 [Plesiomonas shigelloides subsp. oncorhynchi]|nr:hypothetical protein [Plesiomonas shigelloides]
MQILLELLAKGDEILLSEKTYLVPAYIQKDLDVLMVKLPEPVQRFQGKKVLITLAPDSMQKSDAGTVDVSLEAAPEMMAFYSSEAVFNTCGGTKGMRAWIARTNTHRCHLADDKFCHHERLSGRAPWVRFKSVGITTLRYHGGQGTANMQPK